jgi:hypothetical protein
VPKTTETKPPEPPPLVYAYRCPACLFVVTGEYDPTSDVTPGDYFCRTHNEMMHRAILSEGVTVEDAFPAPVTPAESEPEPAPSEAPSESPSDAPTSSDEVSPVS